MTQPFPITLPAGYAPAFAVGTSDVDGNISLVGADAPLPVSLSGVVRTPPAPLEGTTSASVQLGPYQPEPGVPVTITLSGTWSGTVSLLRSTDGGATRLPVTVGGTAWGVFTANANEPVWDENDSAATLYLDVALASGSLNYRVAQ